MKTIIGLFTATKPSLWPVLPRLIAAAPLLVIGVLHFTNIGKMVDILIASGIPFPVPNAWAASLTEVTGGLLLLLGLFGRLGGLFALAAMLSAIYGTLVIQGLDPANLPAGLTAIPQVPPLPLPIVVALCGLIVVVVGSGKLSVDWKLATKAA